MGRPSLLSFACSFIVFTAPLGAIAQEVEQTHERAQQTLRDWRDGQGLLPDGADRLLGFVQGTVESIEGGTAVPTDGQATILQNELGIPASWWSESTERVGALPEPDQSEPVHENGAQQPQPETSPRNEAVAYYVHRCVRGDSASAVDDAQREWDELIDEGREPSSVLEAARAIPQDCSYPSFRTAVLASPPVDPDRVDYDVQPGTKIQTK